MAKIATTLESLGRAMDFSAEHKTIFSLQGKRTYQVNDWRELWLYVDNFYTTKQGTRSMGPMHDTTRVELYICRFNKVYKSSGRREGVPASKRMCTNPRKEGVCFAQLRVETKGNRVTVVRPTDAEHTHTIQQMDEYRRSTFFKSLVRKESTEPYSPAAVARALEGIVGENARELGAQGIKRQTVANIRRNVEVETQTLDTPAEEEEDPALFARKQRTLKFNDLNEQVRQAYFDAEQHNVEAAESHLSSFQAALGTFRDW